MDLGLPSETLWLDRLVGATSPDAAGLFYQWGDIVGHDIAEGYNFSSENYEAKNLNLIRSNLSEAQDAARIYYGSDAKMPSISQFQELIDNCVLSTREDGLLVLTSNINGLSLMIRPNGYLSGLEHLTENNLSVWSSTYSSSVNAAALHIRNSIMSINSNGRSLGYNIMAVHS